MTTRTKIKKAGLAAAILAVGGLAAVGAITIGSELTSDPDGDTAPPATDVDADGADDADADAGDATESSDPVTTSAPSTSPEASQVSDVAPPTVPPGVAFAATFDGNTGFHDEFDRGVWHRDDNVVATETWTGDHDMQCGSPESQRQILRDEPEDVFYVCKDHLMTSVGDTSGYSIAWFSPRKVFNGQTTVSVDVNSTNLGKRQWWEVSLVPADFDSDVEDCELCVAGHSAISNFFPRVPDNTFVFGLQAGGQRIMVDYENAPRSTSKLCNDVDPIDPEGCDSKPIRRTWTATDNQDGTVTIEMLDESITMPGSFPEGEWRLVIKDHNYTPMKSETPVGFTWHWDNVLVM